MRILVLFVCLMVCEAAAAGEPQEVTFRNGDLELHGYLFKPAGNGPFPAIIWNHGSEKIAPARPAGHRELADFYVDHGYVAFFPHRHGHGLSPGDYIGDLEERLRAREKDPTARNQEVIRLHELYNLDVVAAVNWLKQQPFVDPQRVAMSGLSYGGIQTILSAEKQLDLRAYVAFAPGAMTWQGNPLLGKRLLEAVRHATAPVFVLQAANDFSVEPARVLGDACRAKIYPAFGTTPRDGHHNFATTRAGIAIWGRDVLDFLDAAMKPPNGLSPGKTATRTL